MTTNKWAGIAIYLVLAAVAVIYAGNSISQWIIWLFMGLVIVHFVEFFVKREVMQAAGGSMFNHFIQTMLFGIVHWKPLEKKGQ